MTDPRSAKEQTSIAKMTTMEFVRLLKQKRIQVQAREGRLRINAPAGAVDAVLRTELKARKAALVELLSDASQEPGAGPKPMSVLELSGRVPLTPAQQGMWLIDHFHPGNVAYNIPEAFRADYPLELAAMQTAVDRVIARHGILRTSFHEEDGELFQSIAEILELRVGFTDLSALPEAQREWYCRELIGGEGLRPFDLKVAPPVRFHLYRLDDRRHVIFVNIHHIVADRASLTILREEVIASIQAAQSRRDAGLPAVGVQFADYAAWAARQMRDEAIERQIVYWKVKLGGLPEGLPMLLEPPLNQPILKKKVPVGATRRVAVTAETQAALFKTGTEEGASPFMTFLAVFAVSLARWSQSRSAGLVDFCIGSPVTLRRDETTRRMIGLLLNMLAFRCEIAPGMSFREVLRQVRGTALEAYENSDVPFQTVVGAINPDRRSGRSPIFQAMFGYETYVVPVAEEFQLDAGPGAARYDLSLHVLESASGGLTAVFEYRTDLFDASDIDRLLAECEAASAGIVRDPDLNVFATEVSRTVGSTDPGTAMKLSSDGLKKVGSGGKSRSSTKGDLVAKAVRLLSAVSIVRPRIRRGNPIVPED